MGYFETFSKIIEKTNLENSLFIDINSSCLKA